MNRYLKLLLLSSFFVNFSGGLLGPIYAIYVEKIGGDILLVGSSFAVFSIVTGLLTWFLASWEDHIKHKVNLLIYSRVLSVIGFVGYLIINEPIGLFIVQIIFGIATALGNPSFDALFSKHLDRGKETSEWGAWEAMFAIVGGISAILGSVIVYYAGFPRIICNYGLHFSLASLIVDFIFVTTHYNPYDETIKKNSFKVDSREFH
jgi:MFS family permease